MYRPDPRIVRQLKGYDCDLDVRWDSDRMRWWVTWRGEDAFLVQNQDRTFRPLDERSVTRAHYLDAWKHRSAAEMQRIMHEENHRISRAGRAKLEDDFRQFMIEDGHRSVFGLANRFTGWTAPEVRV